MKTFYTSDLHLGHERIIELCNRPFSNVETMNRTIINNWNSTVNEGDRVYVLGDVVMGKIADTLPLIEQLNGLKFLIPGNHDRVWPYYHREKHRDEQVESWKRKYGEVGFVTLAPFHIRRDVEGNFIFGMSHFPYEGDSQEDDRYVEHRPTRANIMLKWLAHGHVHDAWRVNKDQINVGVDVWDFYPVPEASLLELMS